MWYAFGVNTGLPINRTAAERAEQERVSRWLDTGMEKRGYRDGLLRDVYPINYLSGKHLQRPVGRTTLEKWIRQEPARGTLGEPEFGLSRWVVAEKKISTVRSELSPSGLLFNEEGWMK